MSSAVATLTFNQQLLKEKEGVDAFVYVAVEKGWAISE
jgi:hypothetical protein